MNPKRIGFWTRGLRCVLTDLAGRMFIRLLAPCDRDCRLWSVGRDEWLVHLVKNPTVKDIR